MTEKKTQKKPTTLVQRLAAVAGDVPALVKDSTVQTGRGGSFKALSHDAVVGALKPIMLEHGVWMTSTILSHEREAITLASGKSASFTEVEIELTFHNLDDVDDTLTMRTFGTGIDTSDKGFGKAVSYGKKYGLNLAFLLETGEDADSGESHEQDHSAGRQQQSQRRQSSPPQQQTASPEQSSRLAKILEACPVAANIPFDVWATVAKEWHDKGTISDAQRKRLYAIAINETGWNPDDVTEVIRSFCNADPGSIPWGRCYDAIVEAFSAYGPSTNPEALRDALGAGLDGGGEPGPGYDQSPPDDGPPPHSDDDIPF